MDHRRWIARGYQRAY